jgi:DNA polymerase
MVEIMEPPANKSLLSSSRPGVPTLYIDYETRSRCDLRKHGAWNYSLDPSTQVLCMAHKIDDMPIGLWQPFLGDNPYMMPAEVFHHVCNGGLIEAHNAFFEYVIWHHVLNWPAVPIERWRCSAALAASQGLPRSLAGAALGAGLAVEKDQEGHRLMLKMCKPRKPTKNDKREWFESREDLIRLGQYCEQDVATEYALSQKLGSLSDFEQRVWHLDMKINTRGVQCDVEACKGAVSMLSQLAQQGKREIEELTEGAVKSPGQVVKLCDWLQQQGVEIADLRAATVKECLKGTVLPDKARRALEIRQANSKSSTKKYQAMIDRAAADGRIRSLLLYWGALTGRWAGAGIQIQNFPSGNLEHETVVGLIEAIREEDLEYLKVFGEPNDVLSSCLRAMLIAKPGHNLIDFDYASIEARILLWLADDQRALDIFRRKECIYKDMAATIYSVIPDKITKAQRKLGKVAVLGLGYGMGDEKFQMTCKKFGIDIDLPFASRIVAAYREKYPRVKQLWRDMNTIALRAVREGVPGRVGHLHISMRDGNMIMLLPSGREIIYRKPFITLEPAPWDELQIIERLNYISPRGPVGTYGAKLIENGTQGAARDMLAYAMLEIDGEGHDIVLSVHDEAAAEVAEGVTLEMILKILERKDEWAEGIPIDSEGWIGKRFRKD